MPKPIRVLFTGGGSAGHIVPNLAIVSALKKQNPFVQLLYVGSRQPMDRELVRHAGIPFRAIFCGKWRRYFSLLNLIDPFFVALGFLQSCYHIIRFWPQVVFMKGGYVGLPVALAAWIFRRPIVLHESDAVMGLANRIVATLAKKVCLGFPGALPFSDKVVLTGNPVRLDLLNGDKNKGYSLTGFSPVRPVLLVWGGSQGAQEINALIVANFEALKSHFQVIHVTGKSKVTSLHDPAYKAFEYVGDELAHLYAITQLAVGRAGANSLYELALVQKPNIILPLKGHQQRNASYFEKEGAGIVLRDTKDFASTLAALAGDPVKQQSMKKALAKISRLDAANQIAQLILNL
ncbi:MAG: UDP-N-acetylglucosamine--N-acetylmuramyl-(pentapeptide) pyrophosphoryl-undecaprenol N-acetylglucosamine transferase [Candidatus Peregrinibacteria bacterium]